jgi:hypothetical protein
MIRSPPLISEPPTGRQGPEPDRDQHRHVLFAIGHFDQQGQVAESVSAIPISAPCRTPDHLCKSSLAIGAFRLGKLRVGEGAVVAAPANLLDEPVAVGGETCMAAAIAGHRVGLRNTAAIRALTSASIMLRSPSPRFAAA